MSETTGALPKPAGVAPDASGLTFFSPNYAPGISFAYFPQSGNVTLVYEAGSPGPTSVYIAHQGQQIPVQLGQGQYSVSAGDYLWIMGQGASCKIQWYYN